MLGDQKDWLDPAVTNPNWVRHDTATVSTVVNSFEVDITAFPIHSQKVVNIWRALSA